ncbi:MAG: peptidoglycan-binding protein [Candidatus Omnitrophica bacterium]|nr:peptidoglycan-binding protein [Candidatus Omnitrophota bacterium]
MRRIVFVVLLAGIFFICQGKSVFAQEENVDTLKGKAADLEEKVTKDQGELSALKKQIKYYEETQLNQKDKDAAANIPPERVIDPGENLGDSNVPLDVATVRKALINAGYLDPNIEDRDGSVMNDAIDKFQEFFGITATGKVGIRTWRKLKNYV